MKSSVFACHTQLVFAPNNTANLFKHENTHIQFLKNLEVCQFLHQGLQKEFLQKQKR
jgi:hypothetical protein